jgi:BirA family transcriptional regulator, biotin operon repressor / biotin---[acetyl-CoA-carboxylase] ligase
MNKTHPDFIFLKETDSTNAYLQELILSGETQPVTIVSADFQRSGKGQGNNNWVSEPGKNFTFSLYYKVNQSQAESLFVINKSIALSIVEFLRKKSSKADIRIKWPNDIIVNGGKIAGILIENLILSNEIHSIIGIGLNLNQETFPKMDNQAVSLKNITSKNHHIRKNLFLLVNIIRNHFEAIEKGETERIENSYNERLLFRNEEREYIIQNEHIRAIILSVDRHGRLVMKTSGGDVLSLEHGQVGYLREDSFPDKKPNFRNEE